MLKSTQKNYHKHLFYLFLFFFGGIVLITTLICLGPNIDNIDRTVFFTWPNTNARILALTGAVNAYTEEYFAYVLTLFCLCYMFLQSFAIPGPIIFSIISGTIFGRWTGLLIVSICATTGSTLCYFLSDTLGKGLVLRVMPESVKKTNKVITENHENLLYYLLFLRVVPVVPNFMINLVSPIIGIPIKTFVVATLLGLIPPNFIHITTGLALQSVQQEGADNTNMLILLGLGFLLLVPIVLKHRSKVKV